MKTKIDKNTELEAIRLRLRRLEMYMEGFHMSLKDPGEQSYCQARSIQKINGMVRPKGMSWGYGVDKKRVPTLEIIMDKVYKKGLVVVG